MPIGKEFATSDVVVVIGAGSIGQAIARRVSAGRHVVLADLRQANADSAAEVDVSSRESVHSLVETATTFGDVNGLIHAAGVSPSQAAPETILLVDLYGTALVLEESPVGRGGTPDEVGTVTALLMGPDGAFITGSDVLTRTYVARSEGLEADGQDRGRVPRGLGAPCGRSSPMRSTHAAPPRGASRPRRRARWLRGRRLTTSS